MSPYPLALPLFSMIAGISSACFREISFPLYSLPLFLAATSIAAVFAGRVVFQWALAICFFVWGNLSTQPYLKPVFPPDSIVRHAGGEPLAIEGIIDGRPEWRETGGRLLVRSSRIFRGETSLRISGGILLYVGEGRSELLAGDLVRFPARIRRPRNFGVPGEFDYERYLALRDIHATAFVASVDDVILIREGAASPLRRHVDRIALDLGKRIGAIVPGEEGAVIRALIIGESGSIPEGVRELFTRTGVSHILSISGFHVGVIAFFLFHLAFAVARRSRFLLLHLCLRRLILLLTIPVIIFYLVLSGAAPATVRSVVMICAYITALLLDRESAPLNSLILAAFLILAFSPVSLFDISFQLSFFAIWGIIVLTPILTAPFDGVGKGPLHWLLLFFMVSVSATAATIVPVSFHFHRVTLTGLIANFLIVPILGYGAVVAGFSALASLYLLPPLGGILLKIAGFLVKLSTSILQVLDGIPLLPVWRSTRFDLAGALIFMMVITFVPWKMARGACCCALVLLFAVSRVPFSDGEAGKLRLDFFSVGQGESSLLTFPDGKRMLIDGGGSYREGALDPGKMLLAPALWRRGIHRLDYMVLSHPHPDHLKGLVFLAEAFNIGEFWESGVNDGGDDYLRLKRILSEKGVKVRRINSSTGTINIGKALVEPLAPDILHESDEDLNDSSLVLNLRFEGSAILFTGDIGFDAEERLLADPSSLRCTILKVAHHGSRSSSSEAFLAAASPQCALIGVGYENRFRLPSPETLQRLRRRGARVYRTDSHGTISVTIGGGNWRVDTYREDGHFN